MAGSHDLLLKSLVDLVGPIHVTLECSLSRKSLLLPAARQLFRWLDIECTCTDIQNRFFTVSSSYDEVDNEYLMKY